MISEPDEDQIVANYLSREPGAAEQRSRAIVSARFDAEQSIWAVRISRPFRAVLSETPTDLMQPARLTVGGADNTARTHNPPGQSLQHRSRSHPPFGSLSELDARVRPSLIVVSAAGPSGPAVAVAAAAETVRTKLIASPGLAPVKWSAAIPSQKKPSTLPAASNSRTSPSGPDPRANS